MSKIYVLDTSVLLAEPNAIYNYADAQVVLPLVVVKELESKRNDLTLGFYARTALRELESLREKGFDLRHGVPINDVGGTLRIEINHVDTSTLPHALRQDSSHDTRILAVANALKDEGHDVTLVSKDLPMRLLASVAAGLNAEDYGVEVKTGVEYDGFIELDVSKEVIDDLYKNGFVRTTDLPEFTKITNLGMILKSGSSSALARLVASGEVRLIPNDIEAFGVRGKSAQQRLALANLLDPNIDIISLGGYGGTGKSVLALAAALEHVLEKRSHKKVVVFRPLYAVGGQDLGFLPGDSEEKMSPWAAAVYDALSAIASRNVIKEVEESQLLEVLPLTHIRGRTFNDSIIIIDEAQNLERNVLLTALSRTGENTKVFISGDVAQRDNLHVGRYDGIASVIEKLKGEELFAHTRLIRSERSRVAALTTRMLDEA